jgi:hypothetical protein
MVEVGYVMDDDCAITDMHSISMPPVGDVKFHLKYRYVVGPGDEST